MTLLALQSNRLSQWKIGASNHLSWYTRFNLADYFFYKNLVPRRNQHTIVNNLKYSHAVIEGDREGKRHTERGRFEYVETIVMEPKFKAITIMSNETNNRMSSNIFFFIIIYTIQFEIQFDSIQFNWFIYFHTYVQCFLGSKKYSSHTLSIHFPPSPASYSQFLLSLSFSLAR